MVMTGRRPPPTRRPTRPCRVRRRGCHPQNTYRHPAVLTKIAISTDVISKGRLDFGIGAGWNEYEHTSIGIPLYQPGERIRRLDEACEIYKSLCRQHLTTYEGRYYRMKDARSEPKPVQEPDPLIVIGGSGEQLTLHVVAKHADIWNATASDGESLRRKVGVLHGHCAAVGRNSEEIEISLQITVDYDDLGATAREAQSYVDAGATHLVLNLRPPFPAGIIARLAAAVIPQIEQR